MKKYTSLSLVFMTLLLVTGCLLTGCDAILVVEEPLRNNPLDPNADPGQIDEDFLPIMEIYLEGTFYATGDTVDLGDGFIVDGDMVSLDFEIRNPGRATLYLVDQALIGYSAHTALVITDYPSLDRIPPLESAYFTMEFTPPGILEVCTAEVNIPYQGEASYEFTVSAEVSIAIAPPENLSAQALGPDSIHLTWDDKSDAETGYVVERQDGDNLWVFLLELEAESTGFTDTGLEQNTEYTYRVYTKTGSGDSVTSNEASASTSLVVVNPPSDLQVTTISYNTLQLDWTDNSDNESNFLIERKTGTGVWATDFATVGEGISTYTDGSCSSETDYTYRVYAYNDDAQSGYSNEAGATTDAALEAPTDLGITKWNFFTLRLDWSDNTDNEIGYYIDRKVGTGSWETPYTSVAADTETFYDGGCTESTSYTYRIYAYMTGETSDYSNEAGEITDAQVVNTPEAYAITQYGAWAAQFTWIDHSDNETEFTIERRTEGGDWSELFNLGPQDGGQISAMDITCGPNETWQYRVYAADGEGNVSGFSEVKQVVNEGDGLAVPTGITAVAQAPDTVDIGWQDNSGLESGFWVFRKKTDEEDFTYDIIHEAATDITIFNDTGCEPSTAYTYRVMAFGGGDTSGLSEPSEATTPP